MEGGEGFAEADTRTVAEGEEGRFHSAELLRGGVEPAGGEEERGVGEEGGVLVESDGGGGDDGLVG